MKVEDHEISKVCKKQDPSKYIKIAEAANGEKKLCCYAVKVLQENNISTFYPNICIALWKMFPELKAFQLAWFEDFPDTDKMEKYIKLYSTPKYGNYLIGGNPEAEGDRNPWKLTAKGRMWAEEVENVLAGKVSAPTKSSRKSSDRDQVNYERVMRPVLESKLFDEFRRELSTKKKLEDVLPDYPVPSERVCGSLRIYYPQPNLKSKIHEKVQYFQGILDQAKKDGKHSKEFALADKFLTWLGLRKIV